MKEKTFDEWVKIYEKKTGVKSSFEYKINIVANRLAHETIIVVLLRIKPLSTNTHPRYIKKKYRRNNNL